MTWKSRIARHLPPPVVRFLKRLIERSPETPKPPPPEIPEPEFVLRALTTQAQPEVLERLCQGVAYVIGAAVPGHIAEFGTMSGRTAELLARSLAFFEKRWARSDNLHGIARRHLFLFDSFEGLPRVDNSPDMESPHVASSVWAPGTCAGISAKDLRTLCARHLPKERIAIKEGWFSDTLPKLPPETKFALVHIDSDLYESAIQVLDALFARGLLSDGAIIFFDDWNCNRANPNFGERRAWSEIITKYGVRFSDEGSYGIFGKKVIVHLN